MIKKTFIVTAGIIGAGIVTLGLLEYIDATTDVFVKPIPKEIKDR